MTATWPFSLPFFEQGSLVDIPVPAIPKLGLDREVGFVVEEKMAKGVHT